MQTKEVKKGRINEYNARIPGSKSVSNRALLIASLAGGISKLKNVSNSEDTQVMIDALKGLGVKITKTKEYIAVQGTSGKFKKPKYPLDLKGTGTAVRFLLCALSLQTFETEIRCNEHMKKRPIKDLLKTLTAMGCKVKYLDQKDKLPIKIKGPISKNIFSISGKVSSQFISGLLMAMPFIGGKMKILGSIVSQDYIYMTEHIMKQFGVNVKKVKNTYTIAGSYRSADLTIEEDQSCKGYFTALKFLHNKKIEQNINQDGDAKLNTILMQIKSGKRKFDLTNTPDLAPTIAVVAATQKGITTLTGLKHIKYKESNRLEALVCELKKCGVNVTAANSNIVIDGSKSRLHGAVINTYNDHRIAMAFAILGSITGKMVIINPNCVNKSFPNFWEELKRSGIKTKSSTDKNVVLIGLRGVGKSSIGLKLSQKLSYNFFDLDSSVESLMNKSIVQIVSDGGWKSFRLLEGVFCKKTKSLKNTVIATGGGTILSSRNCKYLKQNSIIILLRDDIKNITKRIKKDPPRPAILDKNGKNKSLNKLWIERKISYESFADIIYDLNGKHCNGLDITAHSQSLATILKGS